jgi:hypothetical protein
MIEGAIRAARGRRRGAVAAALAIALLGLVAAGAPGAHAAPVPTLVHDVKTGRFTLGTRPLKAGEDPILDYVQPDTEIEPSISVNPDNPLNVVTVYQSGRIADGGDATNGFATSFDGGKTWTTGELPKLTSHPGQGGPFQRASDAVVAFGPNNTVYANSLVFDQPAGPDGLTGPSGISINVSKDGGRTWGNPVFFQNDMANNLNDKNWIAVDNSDAPGHHKGRIYAIWDQVAPVLYDYCDQNCDNAANWLPRLQTIPATVFPGQGIGAYPVVLNDGSLGIVLDTTTNGVPTSQEQADVEPGTTDHTFIAAPVAGSTPYPAPLGFLPPVRISANKSVPQPAQRGSEGLPAAAVDPKSGAIYVVWDDSRFRTDTPTPTNDAVMSKSTDNGATWSAPVRVNPGPKNDHVDHYGVTVSVGTDGALHIAYRQRDESGTAPLYHPEIDTYYQESRDGGKTFTAPLRVNVESSHAQYGAFSRNGLFEGDYYQTASSKGYTYTVRCQGAKQSADEPPAMTPVPKPDPAVPKIALTEQGKGHQHQSCWVALVRDLEPSSAPPPGQIPGPTGPGSTPPVLTPGGRPLRLHLKRLRLSARSTRLQLSGDVAQVKRVSYAIGSRVLARSTRSPFTLVVQLTQGRIGRRVVASIRLRDGRVIKLSRQLYHHG